VRQQNALKRPRIVAASDSNFVESYCVGRNIRALVSQVDKSLLAKELKELGEKSIRDHSGKVSSRDHLIFQLYFFHDLSLAQIARCKSISLSKTGVEKILNRITDRIRMLVLAGNSSEGVRNDKASVSK